MMSATQIILTKMKLIKNVKILCAFEKVSSEMCQK